jgi:hypothetical protein
MKHAALLLLLAAPLHAQGPEALRALGAESFRAAAAPPAVPEPPREPVLQAPPRVLPFAPRAGRTKEVGRVNLAAQLDKQRALLARQLGAAPRDIGVAADAGLRTYYLTFTPAGQAGPVALAALGDLNRLRSSAGVDLRVDGSTVYNFKVSVNIFSPTRGSTLNMRPSQGTRGPSHDVKTGAVLDAVKARSSVFRAGGKEFWLHYGTDVKADGTGLGDTRSFLIIHENGLSSKAWPIAESSLPLNAAGTVDLGGTRVVLTRSAGELVISEAAR